MPANHSRLIDHRTAPPPLQSKWKELGPGNRILFRPDSTASIGTKTSVTWERTRARSIFCWMGLSEFISARALLLLLLLERLTEMSTRLWLASFRQLLIKSETDSPWRKEKVETFGESILAYRRLGRRWDSSAWLNGPFVCRKMVVVSQVPYQFVFVFAKRMRPVRRRQQQHFPQFRTRRRVSIVIID